jgi:hypothetical protein
MTNILDIHRTGGRREARKPRPRWTVPEADDPVAVAETPEAERDDAPAFRRLVVFGSVDATAGHGVRVP